MDTYTFNKFNNMKLSKSLRMPNGTVLPKGTVLSFGTESVTNYKGNRIHYQNIPTHAIENAHGDHLINNELDRDTDGLHYDEIGEGTPGTDVHGSKIVILDKGKGRKGFDALVKKFGNVKDLTFDEITNGYEAEEIEELAFIAYSTEENGTVLIGIFGADDVYAYEADSSETVSFEDVEPGDTAITKDGKLFKVYAKGCGTTWMKQIIDENDLALDHEDFDSDEDTELVYGAFANEDRTIMHYGHKGVEVKK